MKEGFNMDKTNDSSFFDDMMEALHEVEEHQKGNIKLRSNIITIDDESIETKFSKLKETDKQIITIMINRLLDEGTRMVKQ